MIQRLVTIVEGHGEVHSVPILVRRILNLIDPQYFIEAPLSIRVPRSKLLKPNEFERTIDFAARKALPNGGVLVLIDSDDDCPAELAPKLLSRAIAARPDIPIGVVLAEKEYESWFIAAAESLRGLRGLPLDLSPPAYPESIRGAKEWLSSKIPGGTYSPTVDQPSLTTNMSLDAARTTNSFDKLFREIQRILDWRAAT